MIKCLCDVCGKEIKGIIFSVNVKQNSRASIPAPETEITKTEICGDCAKAIVSYIRGREDNGEN